MVKCRRIIGHSEMPKTHRIWSNAAGSQEHGHVTRKRGSIGKLETGPDSIL